LLNQKITGKLIDLSLIFGFFFTPLLFFTQTHDQFELPKIIFLVLLAAPLLVLELGEKKIPKNHPLTLLLLIFFLTQAIACLPAVSLSWITSLGGDYENFAGLFTLLTYLIWYFLFMRVLNPKRIEKVFYFISLTAFFSSLHAIAQHYQFDFIQWNPESVNATREFAAMGNPNFLSAYIAMSIPLFLTLSFRNQPEETQTKSIFSPSYILVLLVAAAFLFLGTAKGQLSLHLDPNNGFSFAARTIGLFCLSLFCIHASRLQLLPVRIFTITVLILGLLSTASRGGFLGAVIGAAVWLLLAFRDQEWKENLYQRWALVSKVQLGASSVILGLLLLVFGWSFIQRLFESAIHASRSLATSRLHIWRPALEIVKTNPFFGVGLDTFKIAFPFYSGIEFNQIDGLFMSSRMAHNELLQIAATSGLVGLAAYLALLAAFALTWFKAYQAAGAHGRWFLIALLSCSVAYQIQNLFSFGVAAINFVWFFLLAAVATFHKTSQNAESPAKLAFLSFYFHKLMVCFLLVLVIFFPVRRLAADIAYGRGDVYSGAIKNPDSQTTKEALTYYSDTEIHYLNRALQLFPWDVKYNLYTGQAYEQRARLDSTKPDWFLNALFYYQKAVQMSPANAYYYNDEGRVYSALSAYSDQYKEKAEQAYGQSVHFSPASPYFILNWMTSLEKIGKTEEARKETQKAFDSDPTFSAKILSQMAFEKYQAGDKADAFRYVNLAAQGNTLSAEAYYCRGIIYLSEKDKKKALNDFLYVQSLHPDPFKNSSVQHLDELIQESQK